MNRHVLRSAFGAHGSVDTCPRQGVAFLGAGGITPSLAQELASSTFHEARESFHDYIYSKLILGDDKGPGVMNPNVPVFPNSNLANSYPAALQPSAAIYNHALNSSLNDGSNALINKPFPNPPQNVMQVGNQKPMKKKPLQPQPNSSSHHGTGNVENPSKVKKKSHHKKKEKTNVCDVCGRGFAEKYTLNRHMLTHTHVKPFSCSKCNMSFSRSDGLAKHMGAGHRRIDAHHCDVCGGTFNSEVSFEQHRREYGNTLPFVCNLCMLAFSQCCHLNYHMKSHSLSKMNDNFIASIQEDKNNTIDVSELIPEDFTPPKKKDSFSGFLFNVGKSALKRNGDSSLGLMNPNIIIKPEIDDMPTCTQLTGASSSNLSPSLVFQALNSHTSGQINMTASSISSTAPSYLPDTSAAGTSGLNPISDAEMKKYFDIKIPNPKFLEGAELHPVGVGEDGLFRCEICGKGFTRKYHMQRHVKLHTRGPIPRAHLLDWTRRPYACGVCKMGFTRQHHLTRHMLIHTGERPHSCHVCGKAFRRYTNLSLHVRTVHGAERPFKCQICGRGFPRLYSLQRHLKLHAKNAALIAMDNNDQMYKSFKPVGSLSVDQLESNKPSAFNPANPDSTRQSPGHGHESSSDHSEDDSEKYDHESSTNENNQTNPEEHSSPHQDHRNYNQNQVGNENFNPQQSSQQNNSQSNSGSSSQGNSRLGPQTHRPPSHEQELINQANRMSRHDGDIMRRPTPVQNSTYGHNMQTPNSNDRFNPQNAIPNQNMRNMDMPVNIPNYNELEMRREANNYSLNQRNNTDGFSIHQQRIQSPHAIMTSLERPGSRSMINQPEGFHHNPTNFSQQQVTLQAQQRVSMDLSSSRSTMSPAGMHETVGYSHGHHLDLGGNRGGLSDPPAYPHPHNVGSIQFTTLYPQQITDHLELHPNPTASPMPVNNHNNNIQY
ncbi:hypothetical protein Btru_064479 [Bulinus truncatus]|nr:hypothetical protein Btru_064479 [Bulinus truncatus]